MKNYISFFFLIVFVGIYGCFEKPCEKTDAPEINFGLLMGGNLTITETKNYENDDDDVTFVDVTKEHVDADLTMSYYKVYCTGKRNGPFTSEFSVNEDGSLYKKSIGYWSFRMDNTDDYIRIFFILEGQELGKFDINYNTLKNYDGKTPYIQFKLKVSQIEDFLTLASSEATIK